MDQNKHVGFLVPALTYPVFNTLTVSSEFFQLQVPKRRLRGGDLALSSGNTVECQIATLASNMKCFDILKTVDSVHQA